jgi:hypothetical protein
MQCCLLFLPRHILWYANYHDFLLSLVEWCTGSRKQTTKSLDACDERSTKSVIGFSESHPIEKAPHYLYPPDLTPLIGIVSRNINCKLKGLPAYEQSKFLSAFESFRDKFPSPRWITFVTIRRLSWNNAYLSWQAWFNGFTHATPWDGTPYSSADSQETTFLLIYFGRWRRFSRLRFEKHEKSLGVAHNITFAWKYRQCQNRSLFACMIISAQKQWIKMCPKME